MKRTSMLTAVFGVLTIFCEPAASHHAFSPVYDANQTIEVDGTVTQFRLINPHAMMTLDVVDANGNTEVWTVEFQGKLHLTVGGWDDDTIRVGERLTVYGNPTHSGSPNMFFRRIVKDDGTELSSARAQGINAIDEQRRQRARARSEQ